MEFALTAVLAAVSTTVNTGTTAQAVDTHNFSRYQIIVDRSPFGPMSGTAADTPQAPFAARFGFIGTAKTNDDLPLMAIIQDKEANNRTYFKSAGETIGAVTIVRIEKSPTAKLVLKQGLETATLTLETKTGAGRPPPGPAAPSRPSPPQPGPPGTGAQPGPRRIPFLRGG